MTVLNKQAIDFSQPLETENGEPVKYICHDVIEYKCARVCVDIATGVVYSSPYVGLKIRNKETTQRAKLREQIESAADEYWQFDNGWISDMKCGDLSHEYLLFVKEPKNVLALLDELEAAERQNGYLREQRDEWERKAIGNFEECAEMSARIEELESQRKLAFTASNRWADKFREAEKRIAELEARPANPINFKESADADYCRGWAWNEVKKELSPEDWTVGDNCTYYGFFCWGWDSRRQFNEQRAAGIGVKGE